MHNSCPLFVPLNATKFHKTEGSEQFLIIVLDSTKFQIVPSYFPAISTGERSAQFSGCDGTWRSQEDMDGARVFLAPIRFIFWIKRTKSTIGSGKALKAYESLVRETSEVPPW